MLRSSWAYAAGMAFVAVLLVVLSEIRYGLNIWDEGFLWYGVQRVWLGEVPLRDFMSYDPGRYYWTAAVARLWGGNGILDIRVAVAFFQWIGLSVAVLLIGRERRWRGLAFVVVATLVMVVWMFPRHKLFDISLAIMQVGVVAWWLARPQRRRYFLAGMSLGLVACFGRNHGVYGVAAHGLAMIWLAASARRWPAWRDVGAWCIGLMVGYLPMLIACVVVPGFAAALWESVAFLFEVKTTNLTLPIPWPWLVPFSQLPAAEGLRQGLVGLTFALLLAYPLAVAVWIRSRIRAGGHISPTIMATACLAIPYAHYAFSRADVGHLAQGIFPSLIGTLIALGATRALWVRWLGVLAVAGVSAVIALPAHPLVACMQSNQCCNDEIVGGERLVVDNQTASDVALLRRLTGEYASHGRPFVAVPYWPGAYAYFGQRSPLWEIYATPPRSAAFQRDEIRRLAAADPGFVVLLEFPLDNREELRYSRTHPLIMQYIVEHFDRLPSANPNYMLFRSRSPGSR